MPRPACIGPTLREAQVLESLIAGKPDKIIAYELGISQKTVEVFVGRLLAKFQVSSRFQLVAKLLGEQRDMWKARALELEAKLGLAE